MSRHAATAWAAGRGPVIAAVAIAVLMVGCGSSPKSIFSPSASAAPPGSTATPSPAPSDLKPVLKGLLDRSGPPPAAYVPSLAGYVVNVHWSDLQPTQGGGLAAGNAIDRADHRGPRAQCRRPHRPRPEDSRLRRGVGAADG